MPPLLTQVKSKLFIVAHRKTWGLLDGEYASVFRGRSLDYDDLREYVPGDEIRDIDWKATARHGAPLVKRYLAVRRQTLMLVVDTSRDMAAQAPSDEPKSAVAIMACGVLGFLALRHGDVVGLVEGDDAHTTFHRAKGSEAHLEALLHSIESRTTLTSGRSELGNQLAFLAEHYRRRMLLVVVSDDRGLGARDVQLLRRLHAQHEILWLTVHDGDPTCNGPGRDAREVGDDCVLPLEVRFEPALRTAYQSAVAARRAALADALDSLGIAHVSVESSETVLAGVFSLLERQRRRAR